MFNFSKENLDFKSRPILIQIKKRLFEQINLDRKKHGLRPVFYDKLAAQVGELHCCEMLAHKYLSHWNLRGLKPYHRYSFLGGRDSVSENCSSIDSTHRAFRTIEDAIKAGLNSHAAMLAEVPPEDGHRKNILNPLHTHVGIGIAVNDNGFRMAQEFIQRYVDVNLSVVSRIKDKVQLAGRILFDGYKLKSIAVFHESPAKPLTVAELKKTSSYSLPNDVDYEYPLLSENWFYSDGRKGSIELKENGTIFTCKFAFKRNLPGIYTICLWLEDGTGKNFIATNISINVQQ